MLVSKAFSQHEERTLARKHALQLMYQGEILEKTPRELIDNGQLVPETQGLGEYALMLLDGAKENLEAIDELIESASDNWTLDRMPVVDRSLLRLTTYECVTLTMYLFRYPSTKPLTWLKSLAATIPRGSLTESWVVLLPSLKASRHNGITGSSNVRGH